MAVSGGWQVGVDVGGTFTDVIAFLPASGDVRTLKVDTRADDPLESLLVALAGVGLAWDDVDDLVHGTTIVTNAIVQGRLAKVALITTEGFADSIAIARQNRLHLYRLDLPPKAVPLVPEERRFEVRERIDARGAILVDLTDGAIEDVVERVAACRPEAVAVSLIHAYANPEHEKRVGERLRTIMSNVALSHRINPEAREYERTSTTVLSAGIMPLAARYLSRLEERKPRASRLHLFHSAGGMASPAAVQELPLGLALSGPAAGVAAAEWTADELDLEQAISFDMGGTTTDVCLIVRGSADIRSERQLGGRALRQPMVAVESIGAGGGSITRLEMGVLRVGPDSAGADPGPACYGRGGAAPTVSDANLILGYLDPQRRLGDSVRLDVDAAHEALAPIARELDVSVPEVALGVVRVVNAAMARALRLVTVERGIDGRGCVLLAFGGAGPMHAAELARAFGNHRVVVPRFSSIFSALGCVGAEPSYSQQQTVRMTSAAWDVDRLAAVRSDLFDRLAAPLKAAGYCDHELMVQDVGSVRYSGQSYAIEVPSPVLDDPEGLGAAFRALHQTLYGFATHEPWELVGLRLRVSAPRRTSLENLVGNRTTVVGAPRTTPCWFDATGPVTTARYDRAGLREGQRIAGPAVVEDQWSTVVIPPSADLVCDRYGHLHITVEDAP